MPQALMLFLSSVPGAVAPSGSNGFTRLDDFLEWNTHSSTSIHGICLWVLLRWIPGSDNQTHVPLRKPARSQRLWSGLETAGRRGAARIGLLLQHCQSGDNCNCSVQAVSPSCRQHTPGDVDWARSHKQKCSAVSSSKPLAAVVHLGPWLKGIYKATEASRQKQTDLKSRNGYQNSLGGGDSFSLPPSPPRALPHHSKQQPPNETTKQNSTQTLYSTSSNTCYTTQAAIQAQGAIYGTSIKCGHQRKSLYLVLHCCKHWKDAQVLVPRTQGMQTWKVGKLPWAHVCMMCNIALKLIDRKQLWKAQRQIQTENPKT